MALTSLDGIHMIREASAMTVRQNLGDLLNEVQYRNGRILITKAGKPVAALVDIALFERIRKLDQEFDQMVTEFARLFEDSSEQEVNSLVSEAVKAARRKPARK
jgi:prevent-host-death family protein